MRIQLLFLGAAVALAAASPAAARDHVVKMLNKGRSGPMVFEPALIKVAAGDTVTFVATDKTHNAESIAGMLPAGAAPFKGKMNQNVSVKFTRPGVYGYKCLPHYGLGMIGAVVVGNPGSNLEAARKVSHPGKAKQAFATLFASSSLRMAAR